MGEQPISSEQIANRKYIGPNKTGDNIDADRTANYVWDTGSSTWVRMTQPSGGGGAITNDGTFAKETGGNLATIATNTTGVATAANQSTMNTTLGTLSTAANQTNGNQQTKITDGTNVLSAPAQGSTTTAQTGILGMAAVTTGSPSYTTGQTSPLSMSTSGNLRVTVGTGSATIGNVGSSTATGIAVPANAFMMGISDGTNLVAIRQASNGFNSTAGGAINSNSVAQFDDVSPTSITENSFGNLRISANRNLYGTIRDAAGNERGANVTASNELVVSDSGLRPAGTSLNTYSVHLTTNATTTPTSSTAYISSISISNEVGGTTSTVTIQDKQGTPLKLVNGLATTALTTAPTVVNFQTPVKMVSGIDIITAGAVAATVDVWINYYQ